jgi:uncharacterized protein involved in exopolysaccharide biosynthesis
MIRTEIQPEPLIGESSSNGHEAESEKEVSLLDVTVLLVAHRRFILRFVLGAAVLSTLVAFLWPARYEAEVVLLPPTQNSSISSALLGQLGNLGALGSLASLAGGSLGLKNQSDMYVALLTSRTVEDAIIYRFELMKEYRKKRVSDTRKKLESRTSASAGSKDGLIRLSVQDHDAKKAAAMANAYVEEFRKLSASLAVTEASRRRLFFEQQMQQAKEKLTDAEESMRQLEQSTGVLQIDSQARSLIESAAVLRAQVVAKQVQIDAMRSFATEDNPNLILAKQQLAALQAQLDRVAGSEKDAGSDINLSKGRVTQAGIEYIRRYRELKYQETVFELLAKEFEIAKLDEAREGSIIQVVDPATVPDKIAFPHRILTIVGGTILGLFIAVFWVWMRKSLTHTFETPENQARLEALKQHWKKRDTLVSGT